MYATIVKANLRVCPCYRNRQLIYFSYSYIIGNISTIGDYIHQEVLMEAIDEQDNSTVVTR